MTTSPKSALNTTGSTPDRRQELLEAARLVMGDFGVKGASMSAVAKAAGLSRQTVYEYFPSRDDLLRESLKYGAARLVNAGREAAAAAGGSPTEHLATMIHVSVGFLRTSPLWATPGRRAELAPHVGLEGGVYLGAGISAITEALEAWWPTADPARVARAADTLARTMVSHGLAPTDENLEELSTQLADLIANGLR